MNARSARDDGATYPLEEQHSPVLHVKPPRLPQVMIEPSLFWTVGDCGSNGAVSYVGTLLDGVSGAGAPERFWGGGGW
jgi:hypothetical protein